MKETILIDINDVKKIEIKEANLKLPLIQFFKVFVIELGTLPMESANDILTIKRKNATKNQFEKLILFLCKNTTSFKIKMKKKKLKNQTTTQ